MSAAPDVEAFFAEVREELEVARTKFPRPNCNFAALVEEVGELARAMLEHGDRLAIRDEACQVAVMAIRVALEGDPSLAAPDWPAVTFGPTAGAGAAGAVAAYRTAEDGAP